MEFTYLIFCILAAYLCGSVPWSLICSKLGSDIDPRSVGDKNPGATNAWKVGGWIVGMSALILDIGKGLLPVLIIFYLSSFSTTSSVGNAIGLACFCAAPIFGHAYSPFLKFRGGKALATSWGVWIAITGGVALLVGIVVLLGMHLFQKNHATTVTICLVAFGLIFALFGSEHIKILWTLNLAIVLFKLRKDYTSGAGFRPWIPALYRRFR